MIEALAPEFIPEDTSAFWTAMVREYGDALAFHRSLYRAGQHRLRIKLMFACCEAAGGTSLIEVGCGAGAITQGLAPMYQEIDAFDSCPELIAGAANLPNVHYWVQDADTWTPTRRYDVAFLSEILEHVRRPDVLLRTCLEACDFIVASAPTDDVLCDERAFSLEARKCPRARMDGAGHIWTWSAEGLLGLFGDAELWFVGDVARHLMVFARSTNGQL